MTLPEEAGKVASGVVDALRGNPLVLGILLVNMLFLGFMYLGISRNREYQAKEFGLLMNNCFPPPREKL